MTDLCVWINGPWQYWGQFPVYLGQLMVDMPELSLDQLTDEFVIANIARVLLCANFSGLPPVPIVARWTRAFNSIQYYNVGCACGGVLPITFCMAFDGHFLDQLVSKKLATEHSDHSPVADAADIDYGSVAGAAATPAGEPTDAHAEA